MRYKLILIIFLGLASLVFSYNPQKASSQDDNTHKIKILLIGLDGADWKIIKSLISANKLPNIKQLIAKGSYGNLKTIVPLISDVIWTSIITGKTPQEHGIVDITAYNPTNKTNVPVTSNLRKVKALWNITSGQGKRTAVLGYRVTYPAENINGVMISDRTDKADYFSANVTSPLLTSLCTQEEFEGFKNTAPINFPLPDYNMRISLLNARTRDHFMGTFAIHLLKKEQFDLSIIYLPGIDWVSHTFWRYMKPNGVKAPDYRNVIKEQYMYCDNIIGELLKNTGENTITLVVSDHGFTSSPARYNYNYSFTGLDYFLKLADMANINLHSKKVSLKEERSYHETPAQKIISIEGGLSKKEMLLVTNMIKRKLELITIRETNKRIFTNIKLFDGNKIRVQVDISYINSHPYHTLSINNNIVYLKDFLTKNISYSGTHSQPAIIIIAGKGIRHKNINSATIYDIAPTLLYLMGLPIGQDMQGKILEDVLDKDFIKYHPAQYIKSYDNITENSYEEPISSPMDDEIKKLMKALGYIN